MVKPMRFKDGVKLTDELIVTLPAGEWLALWTWVNSHDTDGINYLLHEMIIMQVWPQIYNPADIKAVQAEADDQPKNLGEWLQRQSGAEAVPGTEFTTPEGGTRIQKIPGLDRVIVVCDICGVRDEYEGLPFGPLTCGHDGPRHGMAEE